MSTFLCPSCCGETRVLQTRVYGKEANERILRRRRCQSCKERFTTQETIVDDVHVWRKNARINPTATANASNPGATSPSDSALSEVSVHVL